MKLLMTTDTIGGVWTYTLDLARALAQRQVRVHLVALGRPLSPAQEHEAAAIAGVKVTGAVCRLEWMEEPWRDVDAAESLLHAIAEAEQPDVLHLNQFAYNSRPWRVPVLMVGHSCVMTWMRAVRGSDESGNPQWMTYQQRVREGIQQADCFVAPTAAMHGMFERCYGEHSQAQVIHNGRDASCTALAAKRPFVFAAGRVWDEAKNLAMLDAVAPRLKWKTRIAGAMTSPGGESVQPRHARALGVIEPSQVARQMGWASIYALPAKYEPFGLSALEAARAGAALVLGDIPTLREVWGEAALYVDPNDADQLMRTINSLIERPELRAHYARAAQRRARRYTAQRMADQYLKLYCKLRDGCIADATSVEEAA